MSSDNEASDVSAGGHGDVHENSPDQDSVTSGSDGLVLSNGSHMGSVSVDSIDSDSITDPLADGFEDQSQQERGGGGLNTNAFLFEWNHHRYCASTHKESKSNCGVQTRKACDDK